MNSVNLMLTCSGRKSYLVPILKAAGAGLLTAVDADPRANMRHYADAYHQVPPVRDAAAYVDALLRLCREHAVTALLPQNDMDLEILAAARPRFEARGARVAGVSAPLTRVLQDKLEMAAWLKRNGFACPTTVRLGQDPMPEPPLVAKARRGQGSEGLRFCRTRTDFKGLASDSVLQTWIEGEEYNLDILGDGGGKVAAVVPKRKLDMFHGSTDKAIIVGDARLVELGRRLGAALQPLGGIDVDVMVSRNELHVIDINPRLGGGFPFAARACPAYARALVAVCGGRAPEPCKIDAAVGLEIHRELRFARVNPPEA